MKIWKRILIVTMFAFSAFGASAQAKLQINEIMVNNKTNYVDRYGNHSPWIEIYNNSGSSANLGGWYLSDDPNNLKKYLITKGDRNTIIGPRQFLVFWADGNAFYGTFHTNFRFEPGREATVYLADPSGKLIDSMTVPEMASMQPNVSYGRTSDGGSKSAVLEKPTPNINNESVNQGAANERFKTNDPWGAGMSITAVMVVFLALILLYLVFKYTGKFHVRLSHNKSKAKSKNTAATSAAANSDEGISGEVVAAIATVIYQMQSNSHDIENAILTIERQAANYSPWNSKIYGMRQTPQLKK
ncbi:MAG: lamin tail domain-containing protein [Prevotellaceae bacterium]|jgi:sodium pump decarboxylase gamma subunit|nr:lamin tail domain-containing protein [Prevotellaceae bacterium]